MARRKLRKVTVEHSSQDQQNLSQPNSDDSSHAVPNHRNQSENLEGEPTETSGKKRLLLYI